MILQKQHVELIENDNPFKIVEYAGRKCYKSEAKITDYSWSNFVIGLIKKGHTSVLEHGSIYLTKTISFTNEYWSNRYLLCEDELEKLFPKLDNHYCKYRITEITNNQMQINIYTNLRYIFENNIVLFNELFRYYKYDYRANIDINLLGYCLFNPVYNDSYKRLTFDIITNRGISHELVRHRDFSFSQESTRFIDYNSKGNVKFILPIWLYLEFNDTDLYKELTIEDYDKYISSNNSEISIFIKRLITTEKDYNLDKQNGHISGEARQCLNNDTKTELCMTGYLINWLGHTVRNDIQLDDETISFEENKGFIPLRHHATAHIQMQEIARNIYKIINNIKY